MKKFISFLLAAVMLFVFSGCDGSFSDYNMASDGTFSFGSDYSNDPSSDSSVFEGSSSSGSIWSNSSSVYSYQTSSYSQNGSASYPTFYSLNDLRDYLNAQKDNDKFAISFYYKGSDEITARMLAQMTSCLYVNYTSNGDFHTVGITEYPGDHIVDAYFSNDRSSLTADEKKVMDKAIQMVTTAKAKTETDWELELLLHDMLADHITYYDDDRDVSGANAPRFLTAIGAILDGKANCQGYTDAFYMLASMAGFTVSRMNVETTDDLHTVNTILLSGNWYVVDVTFDDQAGDAPTNYRLFNAGRDQINEFFWKPWKEIHQIAAYSGNDSYYKRNNLVFNSVSAFAEYSKNQWLSGQKTVLGVVRNLSDGNKIKSPLEAELNKTGKSCSYTYWSYPDGKDVYYTIFFK